MTESQPVQHRPLNISGRINVETDGQAFDIVAEGDRVVVDLPSLAVLKSLLTGSGGKTQFNALTAQLSRHDLEMVVQLKGQTIATLGRAAEPGTFEKVFNLGGLDVKFRELAKAWFKRGS